MQETTGKDVTGQFKPLTEAIIAAYTDQGSYSRGDSYMRNGNIEAPTLRGVMLRALCKGQRGGPYRVEVSLMPKGAPGERPLAAWDCTCPVDGFCKHIVALLLVWVRNPQTVEVRPDIKLLLQEKSRDELLDLMAKVAARYPEAEDWIETLLATSVKPAAPGAAALPAVSAERIRARANTIIAQVGDAWGAGGRATEALEDLLEAAQRYAEAGQWASAQAIYTGVAEATIAHFNELFDDEGEIYSVLNDCAEGLCETLDGQEMLPAVERLSSDARLALLRTLFHLWNFGRNYGDLDTIEAVPDLIARLVTDQERAQIEGWVREELSRERLEGHSWAGNEPMNFLLTLKGDQLGEEETLAEYRGAGMYTQLADYLLELGRSSEAIEVATNHLSEAADVQRFIVKLLERGDTEAAIALASTKLQDAHWLLRVADQLAVRGLAGRAIALVEQRLRQLQPQPAQPRAGKQTAKERAVERARAQQTAYASLSYLPWLEEHYFQQGMAGAALDAAQQLFKSRPSLQSYEKVRRAAKMHGQPAVLWAEIRPALIAELEKQMNWDALAGLHLEEGEIAAALAVLTEQQGRRTGGWGGSVTASRQWDIANAAAAEFPDEARRIYVDLAERAAGLRQRESYKHAAELLSKARDMYILQGQQAAWITLIADLRQKYSMLRAFKEELAARGL
jgi:uncharacterized Zn finger protein